MAKDTDKCKRVEQISLIKTNELIPYANNARTHSEEQITKLRSSLREFGFVNPVLIDKDKTIIAGHGRIMAAKAEGIEEVPCVLVDHLSEAQKKAYILADNRLALDAGWDNELLKIELDILKELEFNIDLTGFELDEIESLDINIDEEVTEDDFDSEQALADIVEPITKRGDIWQLGRHRLLCGDSTVVTDVDRLMGGNKADMVFTDPPYGISIVGGGGVPKFGKVDGGGVVDAKTYSTIIGDETTDTARDFYNTCVSLGFENFIIWGGNYFTDFLTPSPCWIVWDKENTGNFADVELAWCSSKKGAKLYKWLWNGMSRKGDRKTEGATRVHPTQKPVGLFIDIFKDFEFGSCFDGFGGSGSTLIACEQTNRSCYMMELDEKYCDVIIKRYETLTGNKAELIGGE